MPVDVVKLDIATSTATVAQETYNDVAVVGRSNTEYDLGFGVPTRYSDADSVADDTAVGSDVHVASQALEAMGATDWIVVVLYENEHSEQFGDLDDNYLEVENTPISGRSAVDIGHPDYDAIEVVPTTGVPDPADLEEDQAEVNYDTGEIALGANPAGTEVVVTVDYASTDYSNGLDALSDFDPNIAVFGGLHAGVEDVGDVGYLASWAAGRYCAVPLGLENGATYENDADAMAAAHEVSSAVPTPSLLPVAHKSSDDVGAYVAGQLAVERPWHDPLYYGNSYPGLSTESYRRSMVGEPGQAESFEGGDEENRGGVNVLINVQGTTVLSNSLTSAGASSNYRYLDIWRTEGFITDQAERALVGLALRQNQIPFNDMGRVLIEDALKSSLLQYTGDRKPFNEINVDVPPREELAEENIGNRIWGPISIDGELSGNTHQFEVEFAASL